MMLPDIPDNDSPVCWAPGCRDEAKRAYADAVHTGLCHVHHATIRPFLEDGREPTGRVFDLLGMRLNVLRESNGACLRAPGPCDLRMCRLHLDDGHEPQVLPEPCAVKLANLGGMKLDDIAAVISGVTRERVRQVEIKALRNLKRACERAGIALEDVVGIRAKAA